MPEKKTILVVEDDHNILKLIKYNLEKAGFNCVSAITGEDALALLEREAVDLIILDIMLPKMDGFETCKEIRKTEGIDTIPIIMLTARGEEVDRVVGLELGADDYMVKPFSPRELVLRVKSVLRRREPREKDAPGKILCLETIKLDIPRHKVTVNNKAVGLTAREFKLLTILLERQGRVQSREKLLSDVWHIDAAITTRTVDTHIKCLRKKLGRSGKMIETVRGIGYCLRDRAENY